MHRREEEGWLVLEIAMLPALGWILALLLWLGGIWAVCSHHQVTSRPLNRWRAEIRGTGAVVC